MVRTWIVTAALGAAASACFAGRGTLTLVLPPEGFETCSLVDVSADGRVAAGTAVGEGLGSVAFWWDRGRGFVFAPSLSLEPGTFVARRISGDGRTLVGTGVGAPFLGMHMLRWDVDSPVADRVVNFGFPFHGQVTGAGVSGDGQCVGFSAYYTYRSGYVHFSGLWPITNALAIPELVNVADVSGAGDAVVLAGCRVRRSFFPVPQRAIRYLPATGSVQELPVPPALTGAADWWSDAVGLSPNGRYTLGFVREDLAVSYVRWDANGESLVLVCPEWANGCTALAISDSSPRGGPMAVGYTQNQTATIWWPDGRPESLWARLNLQGAGIDDNTRLLSATSVSSNGRVIVGNARYLSRPIEEQFGFIATLGSPCPADIDDGNGQGVPDDAVGLADLLMAIAWFESGDERFDIDDGSGAGVRDWAVTIDDLVYFLRRYEAGC